MATKFKDGLDDDTGYAMQNTSDAGCIITGTAVSIDGDVTVNHRITIAGLLN